MASKKALSGGCCFCWESETAGGHSVGGESSFVFGLGWHRLLVKEIISRPVPGIVLCSSGR